MLESQIKIAVSDLLRKESTSHTLELCLAVLNGDNTENVEAVIVFARRYRREQIEGESKQHE